jgi:hypothetical protein
MLRTLSGKRWPHGTAWQRMAAHGSAWQRMAAHGSAWQRMAAHGRLEKVPSLLGTL